jgi:hypothetical protein
VTPTNLRRGVLASELECDVCAWHLVRLDPMPGPDGQELFRTVL